MQPNYRSSGNFCIGNDSPRDQVANYVPRSRLGSDNGKIEVATAAKCCVEFS